MSWHKIRAYMLPDPFFIYITLARSTFLSSISIPIPQIHTYCPSRSSHLPLPSPPPLSPTPSNPPPLDSSQHLIVRLISPTSKIPSFSLFHGVPGRARRCPLRGKALGSRPLWQNGEAVLLVLLLPPAYVPSQPGAAPLRSPAGRRDGRNRRRRGGGREGEEEGGRAALDPV